MKLNTVFTINAVVALLFGLALVLMPGTIGAYYGADLNIAGQFIGRLFGSALLAFATMTWIVRDASDSESRRAIVLGLFIEDAIGFVIALMAVLGGIINSLGWSIVVIYLYLALGFGYNQFMAKS